MALCEFKLISSTKQLVSLFYFRVSPLNYKVVSRYNNYQKFEHQEMNKNFLFIALLAILLMNSGYASTLKPGSIPNPFGSSLYNYWLYGGKSQVSLNGQLAQTVEFETEFYKCSTSNIYYGAVKYFSVNGLAPAVSGYPFAQGPSQPVFSCDYTSVLAYQLTYPADLDSQGKENPNGKIWTDIIKLSCDSFNPSGKSANRESPIRRLGQKELLGNSHDVRQVKKFLNGVERVSRNNKFQIQGVEGQGQDQRSPIEGEVNSEFWVIQALRRNDLPCSEVQSLACPANEQCTVINENNVNANSVSELRVERKQTSQIDDQPKEKGSTGQLRRLSSISLLSDIGNRRLFEGSIVGVPVIVDGTVSCTYQELFSLDTGVKCDQSFTLNFGSVQYLFKTYRQVQTQTLSAPQVGLQANFYLVLWVTVGGRYIIVYVPLSFSTLGEKAYLPGDPENLNYNVKAQLFCDASKQLVFYSNYWYAAAFFCENYFVSFNSLLGFSKTGDIVSPTWRKVVEARTWKWTLLVARGAEINAFGQTINVPASIDYLYPLP